MRLRLLDYMREDAYKPLAAEEIAAAIGLQGEEELQQLLEVLSGMEETGEIVRTRVGKYGLPERMNLMVGKLQVHNKGFGFVLATEPGESDVFVSADGMRGAMHNDRVMVRIQSQQDTKRKREGEIVRILERGNQKIVGTFELHKGYGLVIPDDKRIDYDIFIAQNDFAGAKNRQKVVVEVTVWPEKRRSAEGKVIEIIGDKGDVGVDIVSIIKKHDLPMQFPGPVMLEAENISQEIVEADIVGRRDLRDWEIVTIDGEDAKDLDDAVSLEKLPNGNYLLGVHIADVSYYVKEGSKLDKEALARGTSVYLADRVLPMLPQRLSNGICSLNPQVGRLTMTALMEINDRGKTVRYEIFPSIIQTRERMTYTAVRQILIDQDPEVRAKYTSLIPMFERMHTLRDILFAMRMNRGAIDFDFPEYKVKLDEQGKPIDIEKRPRTVAESIIEEFMLAANETVARHVFNLQIPFMYRVHEDPDEEKIDRLNELLGMFGLTVRKTEEIEPRMLQAILEKVAGRPEERIVSTTMLRSMKQARYESENLGHFGLAAEFYTHFTSPIRRYPDLIVHRILRKTFSKEKMTTKQLGKMAEELAEIAFHCSGRERAAVEAERETQDFKKAEYMEQFIGETFDGIISSVTAFGIFIELDNGVEGLVHVSNMDDDYYQYWANQHAMVGERTRKTYRIGDAAKIIVLKVNREECTIDFKLVPTEDNGKGKGANKNKKPIKYVAKPGHKTNDKDKKSKGKAGTAASAKPKRGNRPKSTSRSQKSKRK